jgi:pimeloyl-ACP methyl ester carboxylesterase
MEVVIFFVNLYQSINRCDRLKIIGLALLLQLLSLPVMANDWYKDYGLSERVVFSEKFNSAVTFYQTKKHANKPSITLIHGVGGSAEDFKEMVLGLSQNYDLLLLDLPGFGLSQSHEDIFSPQKYATLLIDLLPSLVNSRNYIVGHSMGGNVSVQIALQAPNLVKKLILIDAAGFLNKFSYSEHVAANYLENQLPIAKKYSSIVKSAVSTLNQLLPDPTDILLSSTGRTLILDDNINAISALSVMNEALSTLIWRESPPTFIIWGGKDQVMPVQVSSMLSYLLNTHEFFIFPEAGHSPQKEYPNDIIKKIENFIDYSQAIYPAQIEISNEEAIIDCAKNDALYRLNNKQFSTVIINNCEQKTVSHLHAKKITLNNSTINFVHLNVNHDEGYAMVLHNSHVEIWGGRLNAVTIAYLNNSQLEFNGVELYANNAVVMSNLPTTISASLTKINLQGTVQHWHGVIDIGL